MKINFTIDQRVRFLLGTVCIFFIIGFLMSLKLWQAERLFPHAPVGSFPVLPTPFDFILLGLVIIGLGWTAYRYNRWIVVSVIGSLALILLQDQMRWQPWVYMYLLFLLPFALIDKTKLQFNHPVFLTCFQIILIGMYLWGGLHKFTSSFFEVAFPDILTGLFKITDEETIDNLKWLGLLVPTIEVLVAISLIFSKTRNLAVLMGITTHLFILAYLSPLGINHNAIVYPWNIALITLIFLAFYNQKNTIEWFPKQHRLAVGLVFAFACVLPALNLGDKWDNYFSFNLYTDNISDLFVVLPEEEAAMLPEALQPYIYDVEVKEGYKSINVSRWSFGELNVPINPEPRIFKQISKVFCTNVSSSGNVIFLEITRKEPRETEQYWCRDL